MGPCPVGMPWGMLEGPLLDDPGDPAGVTGGSCRLSGSTGASACTTCQHKQMVTMCSHHGHACPPWKVAAL